MIRLNTTKDYIDQALRDAGIVELRHHDGRHWRTGWFDDLSLLLQVVGKHSGTGNLYTSLNAPKPRPVTNSMSGKPVRDADIGWIVRLPFDFDPERPTGVCSTEDELKESCAVRDGFVSAMRALDWPMPLLAKSGNGYHAMYRTRLPANAETKEQLRIIYSELRTDFGTPEVSFDRTVRNPGRIFRLYGTVNRKGDNTAERPHRKSTVLIPTEWRQVTQKQIDRLANAYARQCKRPSKSVSPRNNGVTGKGDYSSLNVVSWFQSHGLYLRPVESNKHAVKCPWQVSHTTSSPSYGGDTIIYEADEGWPGFYCHHSHCEDRNLQDVIAQLGDADSFCSAEWRVQR